MWNKGERRMSQENKKNLAIILVLVFLAGWFSFTYYIYTNQILIVPIEGEIVDFKATTTALHEGMVDRNVKAIILDLNTPGGYVDSCMEIAAYVATVAKIKPVIAIMEDMCASGGYYIASFASYILTHRNTITGSIGVIAVWVDMSQYYKNQGINITIWLTGSEKDMGADWRGPTQKEYESINASVHSIFQTLLVDIQKNRELSQNAIDEIKSGATFSGEKAIELGLADRIGDIVDAKEEAIKRTGIWKFIIVFPEMDEKNKFLRALF